MRAELNGCIGIIVGMIIGLVFWVCSFIVFYQIGV